MHICILEIEIARIDDLGFACSFALADFKDLANELIVCPSHNLDTHL
jgi:hypothetical protein